VDCYRAGLKDNPALGGKVLVQWQTRFDPGEQAGYGKGAPDGIARDAHGVTLYPISGLKIVQSALKHPGVEACLLEALRPLKFPSFNLGLTTVTWPLVLVPETGEVQSTLPDSGR
jgi:hypothetical protein